MFSIALYLITLTIQPQLWVTVFKDWPTDYICILLMFGSLVLSGNIENFFQFSIFDRFLTIFVFWVTLCALVNGWTPDSQAKVIFYWKMLLVVRLIVSLLNDIERTRQITVWLTFLALILAIQAIQQKLSDDGMGWAGQGRGWIDPIAAAAGEKGRSRWIGIFGGQGVYAVLFTTTWPFMLAYLIKEYGIGQKILVALCIFILLWAVYCTGARGGMVASLFVLSLYLLIRAQFSTMTILKIITLVVTVYSLAPSHLTTIRDVSNSSQYRVEMWAASLDMVKGNPVFGIGPGNFREWSGRLIGHNSAVEIQGELGPIGLLLWISMIYVCIKGIILFRSTARDVRYKWFGMALILSVIGYVTSAMFVTLEYETFYLLLAFCSVLGRCSSVPIHFVRSDFINILSIAVVWLIYLQTFVIIYLG